MDYLKKKPEALFCGILLAIMTIIMTAEVVCRYFLGQSLIWAEELVRYMFIWTIFIGSASCIPLKGHITVDLLTQILPKKVCYWMECFTSLFWIAICGWFGYLSASYTMTVYQRGEFSTAMHLPMWIVYLALPLGFFLMLIRLIILFYQEYIRKKPEPSDAQ